MSTCVPLVNLTGVTFKIPDTDINIIDLSIELYTVGMFGYKEIYQTDHQVLYNGYKHRKNKQKLRTTLRANNLKINDIILL